MKDTPGAGQVPDDEVERRLAALKHGADPSAFGSGRLGEGAANDASAQAGAGSSRPALTGEIIDDGRASAPRADHPAAPSGRGDQRPGARRPSGPGVRAISWSWDQARAGRLGMWIGVGLVLFGGYLVLAEFVPAVSIVGSIALAVIGAVLVGWHLTGRAGTWALYAGAILGGFGIARVVADLADAPSAGWGTLGAGLGLLAIAVRRLIRREGVGWQAWVGGALAIWGGWGVLGATIPGFPTLGDLIVPVILVLIGISFLRRGMR